MQERLQRDNRRAVVVLVAVTAIGTAIFLRFGPERLQAAPSGGSASNAAPAAGALDLTPSQLNSITIAALTTKTFLVEKESVGRIDYDDDLSVQVYPPYQGKLGKVFVQLGDNVEKGQTLYTIDSPDLINAESTLVGAAASNALTDKELARARELYATNRGVSQREMEQAITDQQTAEGAFKAARDAVRIFGKSDAEIDRIISSRKIDSSLVVRSPISGQVTALDAPPGLFVQPASAPAPCSVADLSLKWMLANVIESDTPLYHVGDPVKVTVLAYPGRAFDGKISKVYPNVDPNTHRMTVRCVVADAKGELRPGMLADFTIQVAKPIEATGIPVNGVVRNGDGTMAAWVTTDRHHFVQRIVKVGLVRDGEYQVISGLNAGELAVTDGAVFLNYMLEAPPPD